MKKVLYSGVAVLVFAFLTVPAWAQEGGGGHGSGKSVKASSKSKASTHASAGAHTPASGTRSNKGGEVRGTARAEEVQKMNTRADEERGFTVAPGLAKAEQQAGGKTGEQKSEHGKATSQEKKGKGKEHKPGQLGKDESKDKD